MKLKEQIKKIEESKDDSIKELQTKLEKIEIIETVLKIESTFYFKDSFLEMVITQIYQFALSACIIKKGLKSMEELNVTKYIELQGVTKSYNMGEIEIRAVDNISFTIDKGEFVIIVGPSGAGKSTVLNMLGGMDFCDEGQIIVDGREISTYTSKELTSYRRHDIGFVFQFYNLVQNLTAFENIELATQICKNPLNPEKVIELVGLKERKSNFPAQLSGGEQQRVAIARALAKNPKILLCDEPTGALDYDTGKTILKLLENTCRKSGMTVVVITHNYAITPMADKIIKIKNGRIDSITVNDNPIPVQRIEW